MYIAVCAVSSHKSKLYVVNVSLGPNKISNNRLQNFYVLELGASVVSLICCIAVSCITVFNKRVLPTTFLHGRFVCQVVLLHYYISVICQLYRLFLAISSG